MKSKISNTDIEIVRGLQQKDEAVEISFYTDCFRYFKERQKGIMVCESGFVEGYDLFQDAYLVLWNEITSRNIHVRDNSLFRYNKWGVSRKLSVSLKSFLMSIVKNKSYELLREEGLYVHESLEALGFDDYEPEISREGIVELVVASLPKRCQEILTLFYYEHKSLDEILAIRKENVSKDGLKSGKSKCMGQLKERVLAEFKKYRLKSY